MSKIILVTGANQGIGYEIVRQLAQQGHTVFLGARDQSKGKEAEAKLHAAKLTNVKFIQMDVTSQESVDEAVNQFSSLHHFHHLDILVNNAGVHLEAHGDPFSDVELVKKVYDVNVFGVMRVTKAFLPLLKKSTLPIITNISSGLGSLALMTNPDFPFYKAQIPGYNSSKSALNMYSASLTTFIPEVKINVISPGYVSTNLTHFTPGAMTPEVSAAGVIKNGILLEKDGPNSKFLSFDGSVLPW